MKKYALKNKSLTSRPMMHAYQTKHETINKVEMKNHKIMKNSNQNKDASLLE